MTRRLLSILAALVLLLAACGDDDTAADEPAGDDTSQQDDGQDASQDGAAPPMGPAELTAEDQTGDGTEVTVASVTLPAAGFLVVHADADGAPGPVIGHTELLEEGESTDVVVPLDEPLTASATVWPMAHIDTDTNGEYDFDPPESTVDGPATDAAGDVVVVPVEYTVEDDGDGGGEEASSSVTIQDFAFDPATIEVAAGATITWTNEDGVTHTVTAGEPGSAEDTFDQTLDAGATAEISFDEAGTYPYFCAIHPSMTGEVVVS